MNDLAQLSKDYYRIEKAIHFLKDNFQDQPDLGKMAAAAGLSEYHFQRIFQRWAGISPKRFLQFLTKEHAKTVLQKSNVLDASYDAGLSGPGRLHDLFINCEAMSPGEYKEKGRGLTISYGFHPTPFGECFIALTERGICSLVFPDKDERKQVLTDLRKDWTNAAIKQDPAKTAKVVKAVFVSGGKINLLCRGTNFQIKVWEALLKIRPGKLVTYGTIAREIGSPKAVRAVGTAVGMNPVSFVIPCHRVIRGMGEMGGYRWGLSRKRAMLGMEIR